MLESVSHIREKLISTWNNCNKYLYFCFDYKKNCVKIGSTKDINRRKKELCRLYRDSDLIFNVIPNAGCIETILHRSLKRYRIPDYPELHETPIGVEWYSDYDLSITNMYLWINDITTKNL